MKWLKLDCDFRNDPKVRALARQWGGCDGAGFWTLLLAFVGAHGGTDCRVRIDDGGAIDTRAIADWFSLTPRSVIARLTIVARLNLIDERAWLDEQTISIPKMQKRVDEYTRKLRTKSGHAPDNVRNLSHVEEEIEEEEEVEEERDKEIHSRLRAGFTEIWEKYPAKDGRKDAERHFNASVKSDADLDDMRRALANYLQHLSVNTWKRPKSGRTWFNNWRDWINWIEPEAHDEQRNGGGYTRTAAGSSRLKARPFVSKQ